MSFFERILFTVLIIAVSACGEAHFSGKSGKHSTDVNTNIVEPSCEATGTCTVVPCTEVGTDNPTQSDDSTSQNGVNQNVAGQNQNAYGASNQSGTNQSATNQSGTNQNGTNQSGDSASSSNCPIPAPGTNQSAG